MDDGGAADVVLYEIYAAFVDRFVYQVGCNVSASTTDSRKRVRAAISSCETLAAQDRVLALRFALGGESASRYLNGGVQLLFSTANYAGDAADTDYKPRDRLPLAPGSRAETTVRLAVAEALLDAHDIAVREAPRTLANAAKLALDAVRARTDAIDPQFDRQEIVDLIEQLIDTVDKYMLPLALRTRGPELRFDLTVLPDAAELRVVSAVFKTVADTTPGDTDEAKALRAQLAKGVEAVQLLRVLKDDIRVNGLPDQEDSDPVRLQLIRMRDELRGRDAVGGSGRRSRASTAGAGALGYTAPTAAERRGELWTEFLREVAVSSDPFLVFARLVAGVVGVGVDLLLEPPDEADVRRRDALIKQSEEVSKRASDLQGEIVKSVVGNALKNSSLALEQSDGTLMVVDAPLREQLQKSLKGDSGAPFFDANLRLNRLIDKKASESTTLVQLVSALTNSTVEISEALSAAPSTRTKYGAAGQNGEEGALTTAGSALAMPRNSYTLVLRQDVVAAIRQAHSHLNTELANRRAAYKSRSLTLWELIEGGNDELTQRFAELVAHVLRQNRLHVGHSWSDDPKLNGRGTSSLSAAYAPLVATNAAVAQARNALARCARAAFDFQKSIPTPPEFGASDLLVAREAALKRAADVNLDFHPQNAFYAFGSMRGFRGRF